MSPGWRTRAFWGEKEALGDNKPGMALKSWRLFWTPARCFQFLKPATPGFWFAWRCGSPSGGKDNWPGRAFGPKVHAKLSSRPMGLGMRSRESWRPRIEERGRAE